MLVKVVLVDVNPKMIQAWQATFEENPEVDVVLGSMLDQNVSAWVSPTNARGSMDLDGIIKNQLGIGIEKRVQQEIGRGRPTAGFCPWATPRVCRPNRTCPATLSRRQRWLTPARTSATRSTWPWRARRRCRRCTCRARPGSIRAVALPGRRRQHRQGSGRVRPTSCGRRTACFEREFTSFADMRDALEEQLGDLGPAHSHPNSRRSRAATTARPRRAGEDL